MSDSFLQRVMLVFDSVEAQLTHMHGGSGEIVIYNLVSCLYLCLKLDT